MYADCTKCLIIEACQKAYKVFGDPPCSMDTMSMEEQLECDNMMSWSTDVLIKEVIRLRREIKEAD